MSESHLIADEHRDRFRVIFEKFEKVLTFYDLPCSVETAKKLAVWADNYSPGDTELRDLCIELRGRIMDETRGREFFTLSLQEAEHYHHPIRKWEGVVERFPKAIADIEEAWKCFALARYTASVFHSLQVVEVGLIELGDFIGINDPISGWTAVAQRLKKIIDTKYRDLSDFEKKHRLFLEQVQGTVEALKNAWRNKVSHVHGKLTLMTGEEFHPDIAEEILLATRGFMRRLVEGLPPRDAA
jgi:hypothetical protein